MACKSGCWGCDGCAGCGSCSNSCTADNSGTSSCGCTGSCNGCHGGCDSGCKDGCGDACTSCTGCTGCTSCQGCTGTCEGHCDNACLSQSAAADIANLAGNLGRIIKADEIQSLQSAIYKEYVRRSLAIDPNVQSIKKVEYHQKLFNDVKGLSGLDIQVNREDVIVASNYKNAREAIKTLMVINVYK